MFMMHDLLWKSNVLSLALAVLVIGFGIWTMVSLILLIVKKKKSRWLIVSGILTVAAATALGAVKISEYNTDKWYYDLRHDLITSFDQIDKIDSSFSDVDLSLYIYLKPDASDKKQSETATQIFNYMADYFLKQDGLKKSQKSWTDRHIVVYEDLTIIFYQTDGTEIAQFCSGEDTGAYDDSKGWYRVPNHYHNWWYTGSDGNGTKFVPPYVESES